MARSFGRGAPVGCSICLQMLIAFGAAAAGIGSAAAETEEEELTELVVVGSRLATSGLDGALSPAV